MRPRDVRTFEDVCRLNRDNIDIIDFWMVVEGDGEVCITASLLPLFSARALYLAHVRGAGQIRIPRKDFTRLVDWYNRDQKLRRKRA